MDTDGAGVPHGITARLRRCGRRDWTVARAPVTSPATGMDRLVTERSPAGRPATGRRAPNGAEARLRPLVAEALAARGTSGNLSPVATPRWHADEVNGPGIHLSVAPELRLFVSLERREGPTAVVTDGASTLGHVVESLGVPLTEVGRLLVDGRGSPSPTSRRRGARRGAPVDPAPARAGGAAALPARRPPGHPRPAPAAAGRRRGVRERGHRRPRPAARSPRPKAGCFSRATGGLLRRRETLGGRYVYSDRPDEQLRDVLGRFAPRPGPLDPLHGLQRASARTRTRTRSASSWSTARDTRTTCSRSAPPAGGCTGAARTTPAWRRSSRVRVGRVRRRGWSLSSPARRADQPPLGERGGRWTMPVAPSWVRPGSRLRPRSARTAGIPLRP